jgi:copper chaperone
MITLRVEGMSGGSCKSIIIQAIQAVDSEAAVQIDLNAGLVNIRTRAPIGKLRIAIETQGFEILGQDQSAPM